MASGAGTLACCSAHASILLGVGPAVVSGRRASRFELRLAIRAGRAEQHAGRMPPLDGLLGVCPVAGHTGLGGDAAGLLRLVRHLAILAENQRMSQFLLLKFLSGIKTYGTPINGSPHQPFIFLTRYVQLPANNGDDTGAAASFLTPQHFLHLNSILHRI